ncbi:MAG TPA: hypothetical protein VMD02_01645 [Candidatus Omnitrophota bacterium]|nr:hypothetical protein [Candidatus Omnitrophota bacterium]
MSKLLEKLKNNKMTLIVQLPENTAEMAAAAERAGADAIVIRDGDDVSGISSAVKVPVGLDISDQAEIDEKTARSHDKFDFVNFHFEALKTVSKKLKTGKIIALNEEYTLDKIIGVEETGAQAIDAAILPLGASSKELMVGDLQNYIAIAISSGLPVIIPTQRSIKPSEVAIIADTGARGIILTEEVLGDNVRSLEKNLKEYRTAADDLG